MTPIPAKAMPVVEVIRYKVRRPATLPEVYNGLTNPVLRWVSRWQHGLVPFCPMGLALNARVNAPTTASEFGYPVGDEAVQAFYHWWDTLDEEDREEAVATLWEGM